MAKPHDDGTAITCNACRGKGRSNGTIKMRHPFLPKAWDDRYKCKMHNVAMANIETEKEVKQLKKKQKPMSIFCVTIKKKDKNEDEEEEVVPISSRVHVDLTVTQEKQRKA